MLNIAVEKEINTIEEAIKWLRVPEVKIRLTPKSIEANGELNEEMIHSLTFMGDITSVTNRRNIKEAPIKENGHVTYLSTKTKFKQEEREIKIGDVYCVDYGQPVGRELGYIRPALVVGISQSNGCFIVLPFTSKAKQGEVYRFNLNADNLKNADTAFLEKSATMVTSVLLDQKKPMDRSRFGKYYGTLNKEVLDEILILAKLKETTKRHITLNSLELTAKQEKILEIADRTSDLLGVANNDKFNYEQRVRGILSVFGFKVQMGGDVEYLINLIMNTRNKAGRIDISQEAEFLALGGIVNAQTIHGKMVELTKKRFKDIHPCLVDLVTLINKMAA